MITQPQSHSVPQGYLEKQGLPTVRDVTCSVEETSHKGNVPKSDLQTSHFLSNSESRFLKSFIWNIKANQEMLQMQVHKKFHILQLLQQKLQTQGEDRIRLWVKPQGVWKFTTKVVDQSKRPKMIQDDIIPAEKDLK